MKREELCSTFENKQAAGSSNAAGGRRAAWDRTLPFPAHLKLVTGDAVRRRRSNSTRLAGERDFSGMSARSAHGLGRLFRSVPPGTTPFPYCALDGQQVVTRSLPRLARKLPGRTLTLCCSLLKRPWPLLPGVLFLSGLHPTPRRSAPFAIAWLAPPAL